MRLIPKSLPFSAASVLLLTTAVVLAQAPAPQRPTKPERTVESPLQIQKSVANQIRQAEQAELSVAAVTGARNAQAKRAAAVAALDGILRSGPEMLAQHALTFLSSATPSGLESAVRARTTRLAAKEELSWTDQHLLQSCQEFLARRGDTASRQALIEKIDSPDPTLRTRSYRAIRDAARKQEPWITTDVVAALKERATEEPHAAARVAASAALAAAPSVSDEEKTALRATARESASSGAEMRTYLEFASDSDTATSARTATSDTPAPPTSEDLLTVAESGGHDERLFALQALVTRNDPGVATKIASWAQSEDWRQRLRSAYYLVLTQDSATASARLATEDNALVQTALLSAIAQQPTGTKGGGR